MVYLIKRKDWDAKNKSVLTSKIEDVLKLVHSLPIFEKMALEYGVPSPEHISKKNTTAWADWEIAYNAFYDYYNNEWLPTISTQIQNLEYGSSLRFCDYTITVV